jgi:hypothetical protein
MKSPTKDNHQRVCNGCQFKERLVERPGAFAWLYHAGGFMGWKPVVGFITDWKPVLLYITGWKPVPR